MKTFTVSIPIESIHEEKEVIRMLKATDAYLAINELHEKLFRQPIKYGDKTTGDLEEMRAEFFQILGQYDISLDDLT